ncbi:MAG: serine--tRNA ligase [Nanoarchaeota archaeon]
MLDMKRIRTDHEAVRKDLQRRKDPKLLAVLDELLERDKKWRALKNESDSIRHERNVISERINEAKKKGQDPKGIIAEAKEIPGRLKTIEERMENVYESELVPLLRRIPNFMHDLVPFGASAEDNPTIKLWGDRPEFSFSIRNHVEIAESLGLVDFDASATVAGNGFYFLKGDLAMLNQALIRFAIDTMAKQGYQYVEPPLMVQRRILTAAMDTTGFDQTIYRVDGDDLCLIGTSEHAILGMLDGATLKETQLPMRLFAYSMCFRREIGSHGINEKGLWRTHQFNKVEMFAFTSPEQSWALFDEMLGISEDILQALGLPYRIIECCTADLAIWKSRSFDLEVWRPTTGAYGEVMSLSNCLDFQARDLNIRFVRKDGAYEVAHTLNNTALATSRIMVAILENYQQEDGHVRVPKVLQQYMGKKVI